MIAQGQQLDTSGERGPSAAGFGQAVAWAVQVLITRFDEPTMALELLNESGMTLADLEEAGADEYDLAPIRFALEAEGGR